MKVFFIASTGYTLFLMRVQFRSGPPAAPLVRRYHAETHRPRRHTQDSHLDTFKLEYMLPVVAIFALIANYAFTPVEILWSFSIWLESVAILPQLFMLQRTGEAETITTHYLAALGLYRGLYIPNWIYRCGPGAARRGSGRRTDAIPCRPATGTLPRALLMALPSWPG